MRGCHNCEHAAEIAAGKFAETAWDDTPCAACPTFRGRPEMEVGDAEDWPEPSAEGDSPGGTEEPQADGNEIDVMPVTVLEEFMREFMLMSPRVRDSVCMRFQGWTYEAIGGRWGVSAAAVEMRLARAVRRWPELAALFVGKPTTAERRLR